MSRNANQANVTLLVGAVDFLQRIFTLQLPLSFNFVPCRDKKNLEFSFYTQISFHFFFILIYICVYVFLSDFGAMILHKQNVQLLIKVDRESSRCEVRRKDERCLDMRTQILPNNIKAQKKIQITLYIS